MDGFQIIVGSLTTLVLYGLLIAGVWKIFQLHKEMQEVKEMLRDMKRSSLVNPVASVAPPELPPTSPEELVRAIHRKGAVDAILSERT